MSGANLMPRLFALPGGAWIDLGLVRAVHPKDDAGPSVYLHGESHAFLWRGKFETMGAAIQWAAGIAAAVNALHATATRH